MSASLPSTTDMFSASSISSLEISARENASSGKYNARVNFGLLRLYQMYPNKSDLDMLLLILASALCALPEPDFLQAIYLIPAKFSTEPRIAALMELDSLLQKADFSTFWNKVSSNQEIQSVLSTVPDFRGTMRTFISLAISRTYQTIAIEELAAALSMKVGEAQTFAVSMGWTLEGDNQGNGPTSRVRLPSTPANTQRPVRAAVEELGLKQGDVSQLLKILSRG